MKTKILLLAFLSLPLLRTHASHITGGEMSYSCLGNNDYQFTLTVYRDCYYGVPPLDNPAYITVFNSQNSIIDNPAITLSSDTILTLETNCAMAVPSTVCVEKGTYLFTIHLPADPGSYTVAYQRCCRTLTLSNLVDPGNNGMTISCTILNVDAAMCNTSPSFIKYPTVLFCAGVPVNFDHSAEEPDGDSLVYELCAADPGSDSYNPMPYTASSPPYTSVTYQSPYTATYPISAMPSMNIDPASGLMTGTPTAIGYFVVAVCVKEYRNGLLISETRRDFSVYVLSYYLNAEFGVKDNAIAIFPNPSSGLLSVLFPPNSRNGMIRISDIFGREVFHAEFQPNEFSGAIDLSSFPLGSYQVIVTSDDATACEKLILIH